MKAYELIKETFLRKSFIRIVHISWLGLYALLFLIPFPPKVWSWGIFLFGWSGCLLPLLLSSGIFGDDIASGRIGVLIIKPMRLSTLYIWKAVGLSLQGAIHISLAGCIIFILHKITGRGNINNFGLWMFSGWLLFNTWTVLSTSLSVVVKRANNTAILFLAIIIGYILVASLINFFRNERVTAVIMGILRYVFPPVELQIKFATGKYGLIKGIGCVIHAAGLTVLYGLAGIIILCKREFKCQRD